jgi:quercetin dioxygenase-like cupin family protein
LVHREEKLQKIVFVSSMLLATISPLHSGQAQQAALQRLELQKLELPPDKVGFMDLVTIAANASVPPFVHPGVQLAYVLEGDVTLKVEGQPASDLKPGMSFKIPAGARYSFENHGAAAAKLVDFVVEKDQPAATPAP